MQRTRKQLLACAAFAGDEYRGGGVGDGGDQAAQGLRDRAVTDEMRGRLHAYSHCDARGQLDKSPKVFQRKE